MNTYTRWIDTKNRLWICLARYSQIPITSDEFKFQELKMLCVPEEKEYMMNYDKTMELISKGFLIQVTN
jgi:hypothetical protein